MLERMLLAAGGEEKLYVEDVFSTYLYTGNGSTQTITNGIDLAGKGGMVWIKSRSAATDHFIFDTNRGASKFINANNANAQADYSGQGYFLDAFTSTGFTLDAIGDGVNQPGTSFASWTFRKAPKFFDVVTWTGDGTSTRNISHNLGTAPGFIVIKQTSGSGSWWAYHRSLGNNYFLALESASAASDATINRWDATSTTFQANSYFSSNTNGATYVAYLFAHDPTADGIIQCGSYTGNGSATGPTVNLGWEPQYLMIKNASGGGSWQIIDNMRGMPVGSEDATLQANLSGSETAIDYVSPTATGFQVTSTINHVNGDALSYIYIAIRRGPMKTPTVGTSVFQPQATRGAANGTATSNIFTSNWPVDMLWQFYKPGGDSLSPLSVDRLRGGINASYTSSSSAEGTGYGFKFDDQDGLYYSTSFSANSDVSGLMFRRAPGFFDVVCYTGTGSARTVNHNLGVAPELVIIKNRSSTFGWAVVPFSFQPNSFMFLNGVGGISGSSGTITTASSTTVTLDNSYGTMNASGSNYVAYLFASCPGVSKVGSYTGNGSAQVINCGFSSGARFFLVKRTDSTGAWWVYDSARGIVAAADPALALNSTAAEVTSADAVDTNSTGIIVNQEATCNINVNGATYIYLAIA